MKKALVIVAMGLMILSGCTSASEKSLNKAEEYFKEGKYDYAAYNYVKVLETDRENETAYLRLIDSYLELGKLDEAARYLNEAEEMFGVEKLADRRTNWERLKAHLQPTVNEEPSAAPTTAPTDVPEATQTPVPEVTQTPVPEATKAPTSAPTAAPTKKPAPTTAPKKEYTFKEVNKVLYTTSDLNVRDLPCVDGDVLGVLKKNDKVEILRQCNETKWYEFMYNGKVGYSNSKYFSEEKTVTPTPKPTTAPTTAPTPIPTTAPESTPTPKPTEVPTATATPMPTATPTAIPEPTAIPTPQPEFVLQVFGVPDEYTYYSSEGSKLTSARITAVSHGYEYDDSGLGKLTLSFSGEKTYDYADGKSLCGVMWILLDETGNIVANDILYVANLNVGASFTNETSVVSGLLSGKYQLELYNIGTEN